MSRFLARIRLRPAAVKNTFRTRYAQIGGLSFATLVPLFIVPVIYSIFVLDLKVVKWSET